VPLEEFVDRALGVVFRELFNMRDLLFYGDYLRTKDGFDVSYIGCSATLRELYAKILRGRPLFMAEAPLKAAPADIAGAIMDAFGAQ
jgi:hypothetical protein